MPSLTCGSLATPAVQDERGADRGLLPLVSVVTVTFNARDTIGDAIRSLADQTYQGPIEHIVIDGGSVDGTAELLRSLPEPIACLVSEPDNGIYDAMNKGLLRARGRYVALLNADDRFYPEFIAESVAVLEASGADISYCDYDSEGGPIDVGAIDEGILLSQLGIKHNTFLIRSTCFERVGGFDPRLSIVADAKWNRAAFCSGLTFVKTPGRHIFYSSQGLSAAATPERRARIIRESRELLEEQFPTLDRSEAETLYLANYNVHRAAEVIRILQKHGPRSPGLAKALLSALRWNLDNRPGYVFRTGDADQICRLLMLALETGKPLDQLRVEGDEETVANYVELFSTLERITTALASGRRGTVVHFARMFSSPSETFIHDFLQDLAAAEPETLHVMLCDTRIDPEGRPYDFVLAVPWNDLPGLVRRALYDVIWQKVNPHRVIGHFALNGWRLHERLRPEQRDLPWINMCHGVDVFAIGDDPGYTAYIQTYCAEAAHVAFTAVSSFLATMLERAGVPRDKIFVVPNAVAAVYSARRKTEGFWTGERPLRIVSVGRLIAWKGHHHLLQALAAMAEMPGMPGISLDIVYGRDKGELDHLQALANDLGLGDRVNFVEFVDFREDPDYLPGFDLFVLASTLSDDPVPRTETFGVALAEAIAAGLPVISTDAGGIPEVIGQQSAQAVLVPHGNAAELARAIATMVTHREEVFRDAAEQALACAARFSPSARLAAWESVHLWLARPRRRILHFCALGRGGASGATLNIHRGFLRRGYDSRFITRQNEVDRLPAYTAGVIALTPENSVDFNHNEFPRRPDFTTFTLDDHAIDDETIEALAKGADLINFAWPAKFLSIRNIAALTRLGIPVAITLRDMNPITGGCHFFHGCTGWMEGCNDCPQLPAGLDGYAALALAAKKAAWNLDAVTFIALSDNSCEILERSALSGSARRMTLPNYVDTSVFRMEEAEFDTGTEPLPKDRFLLGYLPSFASRVKGHHKLVAALWDLRHRYPLLDVTVVVVANEGLANLPYPVIAVNSIDENARLRAFYNTVDAVVVPSLEETFSNTTLEALACGTPVVGFRTGVLSELLADGTMGRAVEVGDTIALAEAMRDVIEHPRDGALIAAEVARRFGREVRMDAYEAGFRQLMERPVQVVPLSGEGAAALEKLDAAQVKRKAQAMLLRLQSMRQRLLQSESERNGLADRVSALETSTFWRLTKPLQRAVLFGRSLRGHVLRTVKR